MGGKIEALLPPARRGAECIIMSGAATLAHPELLLRPYPDWPAEQQATHIALPPPLPGATAVRPEPS
jgi:hypothetical protein